MGRILKNKPFGYLSIIALIILGIFSFSCEESTGPGSSSTSSNYKLVIYPENTMISSNGGSSRIIVKVYSGNDTTKAVSGVTVSFTATQAGATVYMHVDNNISDSNGYANARVYGGKKTGTIAVTANVQVSSKEKYSDTIFITVAGGSGLISADPLELFADGLSQSSVTATVVDSLGQPIPGTLVRFVTTEGTVTPQSYTDSNGKAMAILKSIPSSVDISATVTATSGSGKIAAVVSNDMNAQKITKTSEALGSVTVLFKGITISGIVDKNLVIANEADSTLISLNVKETSTGNPLKGFSLNYSTTLGKLEKAKGVTDSLGNAKVLLYGGNVSGKGIFKAGVSDSLSFTTEINFIKEIIMKISASPSVLSANGKDVTTITASLSDVDGNPINNSTIYFTTTDGVILPSAVTDQWGEAKVSLRSARYNSVATVTASYGTITKTTDVEFNGAVLTILGSPLILVADNKEKALLTLNYTDASSAPIVDEKITIKTNLGTLYSSTGVESGSSFTDSTSTSGKITAYISSDKSGDAVIVVSTAGSEDSLKVYFTNYTFSLKAKDEEILAGGSKTLITAYLKDVSGATTAIKADDITFSSTLGEISSVTESNDGTVVAELTSGSSAGVATVSASIKNPQVTSSISVNFKAAKADSILLRTSLPTVKLGGSSSTIIATVYDETGNPKVGENVTFSIIKGPGGGESIVPGTAVTNDRGQAIVSFITGISGSERNGVELQAKIGSILSNVVYLTISGEPKTVKVGYESTSFSENDDGTYSVKITAIVSDVNRNKVVDGTIVNFLLKGDAGVIAGQVPTLEGVASTSLVYSPSDAGKYVELTATAGGVDGYLRFPLPGFKPTYFSITAEPKNIPADGKSKVLVRVVLFNSSGESGNNIPNGTKVAFSTEGGTLDPVVAETDSGIAITYLTSDKNPNKIKITAKSGDYEDFTFVTFEEVGSTINEVNAIDLKVDNPVLRANGIASTYVRATLKKYDGTIINVPTTVKFETDLGEITSYVLSDPLNGTAVAQFSSNAVGTARIKASVGSVFEYVNVFLVPGPPHSINLSFNPTSVGIQGSGRNETLIITASVKDDKNNSVADSNLVRFELVGSVDPLTSLSPASSKNNHLSEPVPTVNGAAKVSFHSGVVSGAVRVRATIVDEFGDPLSPQVQSETTQFMVFAGPPYLDLSNPSDPFTESRVTVAGSPLNIYAGELNTENSKSVITVLLGDRYKNPVPQGIAVHFTTTGGIVSTSTGYTDENGLASVTLFAGNPFPTLANSSVIANPNADVAGPATFNLPKYDFDNNGVNNNGIAYVTATSVGLDNLGRQVKVWNYLPVVFSLEVSTFTADVDKSTINVGQTSIIHVKIHDKNGNPIVGGSTLTFDSKLGSLSNRIIETNSPGKTDYYVSLTNNLNPFTDKAGDAIVSITLDSPNGKYTISVPPIYLTID